MKLLLGIIGLYLVTTTQARSPPKDYVDWRPLWELFKEEKANQKEGKPTNTDISEDPYVFQSYSLPETENGTWNERLFPSVANGHMATNVYTDTIFLNGMYNGLMGWSYRARIPALHAVRVEVEDAEYHNHTYTLDARRGWFQERIETDLASITYRTYAHSYYNRLLVTEFHIHRADLNSTEEITIKLNSLAGEESTDFNWEEKEDYNGTYMYQTGQTKEKEIEDDSRHPDRNVYLYWEEMDDEIVLPEEEDMMHSYFLMSIDEVNEGAKQHFDAGIQHLEDDHRGFRQMHYNNWAQIWESGNVELETDDLEVKKAIAGSFYYLYSNLPSPNTYTANNQFYGLSPGGLANGKNTTDYYGHVFWDMETWMYPPILMFQPKMAEDMLSYRINGMDFAFDRAEENGHRGARFPWESGFTGIEVTPDICPKCRENQLHITGDIAFAARQYVAATWDMDWLRNKRPGADYSGGEFIHEMGHFWYTRPTWNQTKSRYEVKGVMPPDEHQEEVDNSVYTNLMADYAINTAAWTACLTDSYPLVDWHRWLKVGRELMFPFESVKRYHEEFEGYEESVQTNTTDPRGVKQADVALLGFPMMWEMPEDVRRNDLEIYEAVTNKEGPAMTWSMYAVGWMDLGEEERAAELFKRSYQPYIREPFKIWTEVQSGVGAVNFITGSGGFLQAVLFGYGGVRLYADHLLVKKSYMPPDTTKITMRGLNYFGSSFDFELTADTVHINHTMAGMYNLTLEYGDTTVDLQGGSYTFDRVEFKIYASSKGPCDAPADEMNVDYSVVTTPAPTTPVPTISRASGVKDSVVVWFVTMVMVALMGKL